VDDSLNLIAERGRAPILMTYDPTHTRRFLPVGLDLQGKECRIVGGGSVGTRKALTLARAGGKVTTIAPAVTEELAEQIEVGRIAWTRDSFRAEHVDGAFFVVAATDNKRLNAEIVRVASQNGALVCDVSSAERSQVIFGALLDGGDFTVAVFTGGHDPAQARRTRDRIARLLNSDAPSDGF
jgi:siroheme synthase-like protein